MVRLPSIIACALKQVFAGHAWVTLDCEETKCLTDLFQTIIALVKIKKLITNTKDIWKIKLVTAYEIG